jgi:hypothetical protein
LFSGHNPRRSSRLQNRRAFLVPTQSSPVADSLIAHLHSRVIARSAATWQSGLLARSGSFHCA